MWLSHSRQSYSCRLKSVIFVVAAATSENCNEWATRIKTKFVSLIAKLQNKTCCWFHSFTFCLPVLRYNRATLWHALLYLVSMTTLAHVMSTLHILSITVVMSTMSSISIISIIYVGNLAWHLCVNSISGTCCNLSKTRLLRCEWCRCLWQCYCYQ